MHYYIDGYNMLFRLTHAADKNDLQDQREQVISELSKKIALIKIDVSLVFDSTFQLGDRTRAHFKELEILFTAYGETADEYILEELKNVHNPHQQTVVTSDKKLALYARLRMAHTESVEDFSTRLNKAYKNKLKHTKIYSSQPRPPLPKSNSPQAPDLPSSPPILTPKAKVEECGDYYEGIFEARLLEFTQEELNKKAERPQLKKKIPRKQQKQWFPTQTHDIKAPSEMERWLQTFEDRWNHLKND